MHPFFKAVAIGVALSTSAAFAQSAAYVLDTTHSFSRFSYNHLGLSTQSHRFDKTTGTVVFDKAAKTGSVDVVIDITSVNTGSAVFNGHIQGEGFFDAAKFPTASFKSTKVTFDGDKPASVDGNLTINGITKPVTLKVTNFVSTTHPMNKKEVVAADATVTIKRTEFNAGKYAPYVSDDVVITVAVEAFKQ
jgi:polyisoprenoid-binding protein YceI